MADHSQKQPGATAHVLGYQQRQTVYNPRAQSLSIEGPRFVSRMSGALLEIVLACVAATLPVLLLSALLLGLVFQYQVDTSDTSYPDLRGPSTDDELGSFYLVNYSATRLMTVASWSSSVACLLTFFIMTLASYPLARQVLHAMKSKPSTWPTPYQLGLLLGAMNANIGSLFSWVTYASWENKLPTTRVVKLAFMTFIFSSVVSYAIVACDTWLHITTSTVIFPQIDRKISTTSLGKGIYSTSCATVDGTKGETPCTIFVVTNGQWFVGVAEAYSVLNNVSATSFVGTFPHNGNTHAYLADANIPKQSDFSATTFAMSTSCAPITSSCLMPNHSGHSLPFNCSTGFYGDLTQKNISGESQMGLIGVQFFDDARLTKRIPSSNFTVKSNPFFMGTWALAPVQQTMPGSSTSSGPLSRDQDIIVIPPNYGWLLNCTATVYDLRYAWINGSFSHVQSLNKSNATMASIVAAPWFARDYSGSSLSNAAYLAGLQNSSTDLASTWGDTFSTNAMALSAGVMSRRKTLQEQTRNNILVAKVMKAPLWCMMTLNLIFVVMAIILTIIALISLKEQNVQEVQTRLSTVGLVGALFEGEHSERVVKSPEEWFSEQHGSGVIRQRRVGIGGTPAGGFGFIVAEAS